MRPPRARCRRRFPDTASRLALALFLDVLDIVFENEEIGLAVARQADEGLVIVFDDAGDLFAVLQLHPNPGVMFDQLLEILRFLERLLGSTRRFSLWWR